MRRWRVPILLAVVVVATVCGGDEPPPMGPAEVASVTVTPGAETLSSIGATVQFQATARDASNNPLSAVTFTWSSSDPGVVTVDEASGLATSVGAGTGTISATAGGVSGDASLIVGIEVGPAGGVVSDEADVVTMTIPVGAMTAPTAITVTPVAESAPDILRLPPASAVYRLEPSGLSFDEPVHVELSGNFNQQTVVYHLFENGGVSLLSTTFDAASQTLNFDIDHFSSIFITEYDAPDPTKGWTVWDIKWVVPTLRVHSPQTNTLVTESLIDLAYSAWQTSGANLPELEHVSDPNNAHWIVEEHPQLTTLLKVRCEFWVPATIIGQACFSDFFTGLSFDVDELGDGDQVTMLILTDFVQDAARATEVLMHEMGHALGIAHTRFSTGEQQEAVMYPAPNRNSLHSWDAEAVCFRYGCDPLGFVSISAGEHTCALTSGAAYCWGYGFHGQLGDGSTTTQTSPVLVSGGHIFAAVDAGYDHTCGVTTSGAAYCWGSNSSGQLGNGGTTNRNTPGLVSGGHTFETVSAGDPQSCGVTTSGATYCWGSGALGDGITNDASVTTSPVLVSGGHTFATVDAGNHAICGITTSSSLYCWGSGVGDGTTDFRLTPVRIGGGLTFGSVSMGEHNCAVTTGGVAYCWGGNFSGQLGDGTFTERTSPVPVAGGLTFSSVSTSSGAGHTCGVTTSGAAYCWGYGFYGQLGNGTTTEQQSVPVPVSGGLTFADLGVGRDHSCGVTTSGVGYCWGTDGSGELGDGPGDSRSSIPVRVVQ